MRWGREGVKDGRTRRRLSSCHLRRVNYHPHLLFVVHSGNGSDGTSQRRGLLLCCSRTAEIIPIIPLTPIECSRGDIIHFITLPSCKIIPPLKSKNHHQHHRRRSSARVKLKECNRDWIRCDLPSTITIHFSVTLPEMVQRHLCIHNGRRRDNEN